MIHPYRRTYPLRSAGPALCITLLSGSVHAQGPAEVAPAPDGHAEAQRLPGADRRFRERLRLFVQGQGRHLTEQGRVLGNQRRYARALALFAMGHAYSPSPDTLLPVAETCLAGGLDLEAFSLYTQMREQRPHLLSPTEVDEALAGLRSKTDGQPTPVIVSQQQKQYLDAAKQHFAAGRYPEAAEASAIAYALNPLPRILFNIAQSYRRSEKPEAAYYFYLRHLEGEPSSPWSNEALSYMRELRGLAFTTPVYRRPWLWVLVGTTAAALVTGVAVGTRTKYPSVDYGYSDLGSVQGR